MMAALDGDAAEHRVLLKRIAPRLCGYYCARLARTERGVFGAEDSTAGSAA